MSIQTLKRKWMVLLGALALLAAPSYAAVGGPGGGSTTFTTTTTNTTINHDTHNLVTVDQYESRVLGLSTLAIHTGGDDYEYYWRNKRVYDRVVAAEDVDYAIHQARRAIINDLTVPARGEICIAPVQIRHSSRHNVTPGDPVVDHTDTTQTVTVTNTVGPATILIGDNQSQTFFVAAGDTNIDVHTHTQFDVYRTITDTDTVTHTTKYIVAGTKIISPIVLNMDGTGKLQASNGNWAPHPGQFFWDRRVLFDFYGTGFPVAMEWVGPSDGLLCKPKADGKIDGTCLFGTATGFENGFEQMASLDGNLDGKLKGAELNGLCVWQDRNGNARPDAGEVKTLKQADITELSINHKDMQSSFVMKGRNCVSFDWWPTTMEIRKVR